MKRRGNNTTNNSGISNAIENIEDILGGGDDAVPQSIYPGGSTASVMSGSTLGFTGRSLQPQKKDDDMASNAGTLTSRGVESLIFSGLSNIDEHRPLHGTVGINNNNNNSSVGGQPQKQKQKQKEAGSQQNRSVSGSVFTEKRQEDIDRLFDDLLGNSSSSNNNNGDDGSTASASTAMSSVMPIVRLNKNINTPMQRNRVSGGGASYSSSSSRNGSSHSKSSNQYIFNNGSKNSNSASTAQSSSSIFPQHDHLLYGGDKDERSTISATLLNTFARFYQARQNRMLHVRAGFVLIFLVSIMYIFVQMTMLNQYNRDEMSKLRDEYSVENNKYSMMYDGPQGEMLDRPNSLRLNNKKSTTTGGLGGITKTSSKGVASGAAADYGNANTGNLGVTAPDNNNNMNSYGSSANNNEGPVDLLPKAAPSLEGANAGNIKTLPESFQNLLDLSDGTVPHNKDIPFFWQVPWGGGGTLRDVLSTCMGIVLAAEPGSRGPSANDATLQVFQTPQGMFVNVDTTYLGGIDRAKQLDLVSSNKADVIVSPWVHQTSVMFTPIHPGRMFAFIRHPIERSTSVYSYLKMVDPEVSKMSLLDYAKSSRIENNWMTRYLSNQMNGEVTFESLVIAKEVLRTKCLIGLKQFLWASIKRYEMFFGWDYTRDPKQQYDCRKDKLLEDVDRRKYPIPEVTEGSQEWTMLLWQNKFDMKLYKYAQELFNEQVSLFPEGTAPK